LPVVERLGGEEEQHTQDKRADQKCSEGRENQFTHR